MNPYIYIKKTLLRFLDNFPLIPINMITLKCSAYGFFLLTIREGWTKLYIM